MRPEPVLLLLLLAGCSGPAAVVVVPDMGTMEGLVLDALLRPISGATVTIQGEVSVVAPDGTYVHHLNWTPGEQAIMFQAPGYVPVTRVVVATTPSQDFRLNVTLAPVAVGRLDTQHYQGLVSCAAIVQVGHSHGSGDPDEDNHVDCSQGFQGQQTFALVADHGVEDLLLELFWEANNEYAQRMTLVLRDDQGDVVSYDEGTSPLRMHFGRGQIQQVFTQGTPTIQVLPGIPEDALADLFVGVHIQQSFDIYATTGYGQEVPIDWTVDR